MRSYEEIADNILRKYNDRLEQKKKRKAIIMRTALSASGLCAAAIVGLNVWNNDKLKNSIHHETGEESIISETTTSANDEADTVIVTTTDKNDKSSVTSFAVTSSDVSRTSVSTSLISDVSVTSVSVTGNKGSTPVSGSGPVSTTEVSAPAAVTSTVTEAAVTTEIILPHERSYYMKKLTAILSAFAMSVPTVTPPDVHAKSKIDPNDYRIEAPYIENIISNDLVIDLDQNGKFDLNDCCILNRYSLLTEQLDEESQAMIDEDPELAELFESFAVKSNIPLSDEEIAYISEHGDYDESGKADQADAEILMIYYIINNDLTYADLDPHTYDPSYQGSKNDVPRDNNSELTFVKTLNSLVKRFELDQYLIEDAISKNIVDADINSDGKVDIMDYAYLKVNGENYCNNYTHPVDGGIDTSPRPHVVKFSDDIQKKCDDFYYARPLLNYNNYRDVNAFLYGIEEYFASHLTLSEEYFDNNYYSSFIDYADEYDIGSNLRYAAEQLGIIEGKSTYFNIDINEFEDGFRRFFENVLIGKTPQPDVNQDGSLDQTDIDLANDFISEVMMDHDETNVEMPIDAWKYIKNNCDLNNNGTYGDIYDIFYIQMYIFIVEEDPDYSDTENMFSYQSGLSLINDLDIERTGDANNDSKVDISDAVIIMQSQSNPSKYKLSGIGRFKGDVNNTGDGITPKDAQTIQKNLLGL
ncbi:MAG: hypothetical protein KBA55_15920 [Ruminococcus sp.]|nr:hypothetical protein [Ruminococcus sp.]